MKHPSVILSILVLGLTLAGCRRTTESWRNPPVAPPVRPTSTPAPSIELPTSMAQPSPAATSGPVTLTYWEDESDDGAVVLDELAAAFMEEHPNIQIERVHFTTDDIRVQYRVAALEGKTPQLVRGASELAGPFGSLETVRPLEVLIPQSFLDGFFPGALTAATIDGRLWGIPDNYGNQLMLIYNKGLVNAVPSSTDEWVAQLKTLTDPAQGQYGLVYDLKDPFWLMPWLGGFGGWALDQSNRPTLATQPMVDALQFLQDLKITDKVMPEDASYESAYQLFRSGKAAYVIDGVWNLDRYRGAGVDFGVTALPRVSRTGLFPSPLTLGKYWFIGKDDEGPTLDAAVAFVEFMTSAAAQETWASKAGRLPSSRAAAASEVITQDPITVGSVDQLSKGRGLQSVPEMYCAWSAMRDPLASVMDGGMDPASASQAMQETAERCIDDLSAGETPDTTTDGTH